MVSAATVVTERQRSGRGQANQLAAAVAGDVDAHDVARRRVDVPERVRQPAHEAVEHGR